MLGLLAAFAVVAASCAKEDTTSQQTFPDGKVPVKFTMKTDAVMAVTKAPGNTYSADGFKIFAFRQDGTDWKFMEELTLKNPVYTPSGTGTGGILTGEAALDEGVYRFIPTYGLNATGAGYSIGDFTADQVWDDASPVSITHTAGSMPEIFTLSGAFGDISDYTVTVGADNPGYNATITRAVARVDVLIVRATGNQTTYVQAPNERSVFGEKTLATATMAFTGMNSNSNYFGALPATPAPFNYTYTIGTGGDATVADDVLIGTATTLTDGTSYGTTGYQGYNAVAAADVLQGAAHLYGPFVIPNADATPAQTAVLTFTDSQGTDRVITLPAASIPLERNYVTIIKIYLLENGDGTIPDDIWSENVNFAVTLDTEYAGNHDVDGGTIGGQPA